MIALIIITGIVALGFLLKFKVDHNIKLLRQRIRSGEVGIPISFFVGNDRLYGVTTGFDMGGRVIADSHGVEYKNISIMEIYPPKPF